jgi:hypothetical protein
MNNIFQQDFEKIYIQPQNINSNTNIINKKHVKDGRNIIKINSNKFYSNWKTDSNHFYNYKHGDNNCNGNDNDNDNDNCNGNNSKLYGNNYFHDDKIQSYINTKNKTPFATPLPINGTNQLDILFNNKCNINTFNWKRYASNMNINSPTWFNNPLYNTDISQETQELNAEYSNKIINQNQNLYNSVFQDMYYMTTDNDIDY